jgi:hypothetical protein
MPETIQNLQIESEQWLDVYSLSIIPKGTPIVLQNIGTSDLYIAISSTKPSNNHNSYRILRRAESLHLADEIPVWVFSTQIDGAANVERAIADKLEAAEMEERFHTTIIPLEDTNALILNELRLLNHRIEEAFETRITEKDL